MADRETATMVYFDDPAAAQEPIGCTCAGDIEGDEVCQNCMITRWFGDDSFAEEIAGKCDA